MKFHRPFYVITAMSPFIPIVKEASSVNRSDIPNMLKILLKNSNITISNSNVAISF